MKRFVKEVIARLKGDEKEVIAIKNSRKAESAINGQLAALQAKLVDDENKVEDAVERLNNAKFPTTLIEDNQVYVRNIKSAQDALDAAQENLAGTEESIEYFLDLKEDFDEVATAE